MEVVKFEILCEDQFDLSHNGQSKLAFIKRKKKDLAPNLQLVKGYIKLENNLKYIYRTV